MKERPILFKAEMSRAILGGLKNQTRRLVKYHPAIGSPADWVKTYLEDPEKFAKYLGKIGRYCHYGNIGDRLWVKETFGFTNQCDDINGNERVVAYKACYPYYMTDANINQLKRFQSGDLMQPNHHCPEPNRWKSSLFMPRWASRTTLEIAGLRVERLHDISQNDAWCEGVSNSPEYDCIELFKQYWIKINGERSWEDNPYVWAINFNRVPQ